MIIEKITDSIIRNVQSIHTLGTKFEVPNIEDLCNQFREVQIRSQYKKTKQVNPKWLQKYNPDYELELQDDPCVVKFKVPNMIMANYVGTLKGKCNYSLVPDRSWVAMYSNHRNANSKPICVWEDGILEIHAEKGKLPKEVMISAAFSNPFELPDYNMDYSEYPIDDDNLAKMQQLLVASILNQAKTPTNYKPTNTDSITTT